MKTTIFAFMAAWVVFITRQIASRADENGNIYIPTPVQLYKAGRRYLSQLWKYVKNIGLKQSESIMSDEESEGYMMDKVRVAVTT